jgi:hypothetical protein
MLQWDGASATMKTILLVDDHRDGSDDGSLVTDSGGSGVIANGELSGNALSVLVP